MGNKISDDIIKQIPILYRELNNKSEVARQLGISPATVRRYLSLSAAAILNEPKKRTKVTPELEQEINRRY